MHIAGVKACLAVMASEGVLFALDSNFAFDDEGRVAPPGMKRGEPHWFVITRVSQAPQKFLNNTTYIIDDGHIHHLSIITQGLVPISPLSTLGCTISYNMVVPLV